MYPRYGRFNRRYKVKIPKEKITFEKRVRLQSIIAVCILAVMTMMSPFSESNIPLRILYKTYSAPQWKEGLTRAVSFVTDSSSGAVKTYHTFMQAVEKRLVPPRPEESKVKADSSESNLKDTTQEQAPIPAPSENPPSEWKPPVWAEVSSPFGGREHPVTGAQSVHTGVDLASPEGTPVVASKKGTVLSVGYDDANGNYVTVDHGNGEVSVYAHLKSSCTKVGDEVSPDIQIGEVGSSGISTGPHLHFEIKKDGVSVDPQNYTFFKR